MSQKSVVSLNQHQQHVLLSQTEFQNSIPKGEPICEAKQKILLDLVTELRSDPQAAAFNLPVNWQVLGIPDYPHIVKKPMDLSTIETKIVKDAADQIDNTPSNDKSQQATAGLQYRYTGEFVRDLNLVWSNCMLFNELGSVIYRKATAMERICNRLL